MVRWNPFRAKPVEAASAPVAQTPQATSMDLIEVTAQVVGSQSLPVINPDPLTIEVLFLHSDELSTVERTVRQKVWRQGLRVESRYAEKCGSCGYQTDRDLDACPDCKSTDLRPPPEAGKRVLEEFMRRCNLDGDALTDVGEDADADGTKHGRLTLILRYSYLLAPNGAILTAKLKEIRRGSPGRIRIVRDNKTGMKGGQHFVCLQCRGKNAYTPEKQPNACHICGGVTYDAWYIETTDYSSNTPKNYYLPSEVHEAPIYYRDGTPPCIRVWHKAWFFVFADYYAKMAFDPRGDKRPDKILAVLGINMESMRKWMKEDVERRRLQPYSPTVLGIEAPTHVSGQVRQDAKVLDMGDEVIKGQALELRQRFAEDIRRQFGLQPIAVGDNSNAGGLNNEGLQREEGAEIIEHRQGVGERWLLRVADALGVPDWRYAFDHPHEEQELLEAGIVEKELANAAAASTGGLMVRWENGRAVISDGPFEQTMPAIPGLAPGQDGEAPKDAEAGGDPKARAPKAPTEQALPTSGKGLNIRVGFGGPSSAPESAGDAAMTAFAGLTAEEGEAVRRQVLQTMSSERWSVARISDRVLPILQRAGLEAAKARADLIARTESAAVLSEYRVRIFEAEEQERGKEYLYRYSGVNDHRRTKLSHWIGQAIGDGKPLRDVLRIMDDGIRHAKTGAFEQGGALATVPGKPIRLPAGFQRRGFVAHFGERDSVVRAY